MRRWAKYIFWGLLIGGACIGTLLAPMLNVSQEIGGAIGLFLGLLLSLAVPNLHESLTQGLEAERRTVLDEGRDLNFIGFLLHPTSLPSTVGIAWGIGFFAIASLIHSRLVIEQTLLGFIPALLGIGLSGYLMIWRHEYVKPGAMMAGYVIVRGNWAILNGILSMLFGWGLGTFLVLSIIFHW